MKKQKIYTTLALSSLLLDGTYVGYADDNVPVVIASTSDVDETIDDGTTPITAPELPPVAEEDTPAPNVPETTPDTDSVDETIDEQPSDPLTETKPDVDEVDETVDKQPSVPSTETSVQPVQDEVLPKTNEEQGKPQETTPEVVEAQPLTTPSLDVPVITSTGVTIVSTENSQLIVQTETGQLEVIAPETVGAVRQSDGTVAVKDNTGKLQVLPATGDDNSGWVSVLGLFSIAISGLLKALSLGRLPR